MRSVALAILIIITNSLQAQDRWVSGLGDMSCREYDSSFKFKEMEVQVIMFSWLQGFMTGMNSRMAASGYYDQMKQLPENFGEITAIIEAGCSANPNSTVLVQATVAYTRLSPYKNTQ